MLAIYKREISAYFTGAIGYVFLTVFMLLNGLIYTLLLLSGKSSLTYVFSYMFTFCMFLIPVLTMRLMPEESKQHTDQLLLTSPVSLLEIVAGKFFASLFIFAVGLLIIIFQAAYISLYVIFDWPVFWCSFLGSFLLGAACISIGLFISTLTENQIVAAVVSFAVMLFISMFNTIASAISSDQIQSLFLEMSFYSRYYNMVLGILDLSDVIFFLSITALFIFLSSRVLEKKRWK